MEILMKLSQKLLGGKKQVMKTELLPDHDVLVEEARQELQEARSLFNNVSEDDLIDHAIFKLNAAERRYIFLLQEARRLRADEQVQIEEGGTLKRGK